MRQPVVCVPTRALHSLIEVQASTLDRHSVVVLGTVVVVHRWVEGLEDGWLSW